MTKRYSLKIDTTFIESKPAGLAAKFLNSGEIHPRAGVEIAIACLFAPLGAAIDGAPQAEVERLIAASHTQMETYFALALSRCQKNFSAEREVAPVAGASRCEIASTNSKTEMELDFEENIDFDDEEI